MRVDDMNNETLEYWSDQAAVRLAERRKNPPHQDDRLLYISFEDDAPDPLNYPADTMAVIIGLRVNLTCDYTPGGCLIVGDNGWTARCGWPNNRGIAIQGSTQQEAVTRLFVAMLIGREVGDKT